MLTVEKADLVAWKSNIYLLCLFTYFFIICFYYLFIFSFICLVGFYYYSFIYLCTWFVYRFVYNNYT